MFKNLVLKNRSYRRFYEDAYFTMDTLRELVDLARLSPSGANRQCLKFYLSAGEKNEKIFECLSWAGYLTDWPGPEPGERPAAYIVVLDDLNIGKSIDADAGIACQTILLGAVEKGFGGCMFGAVDRKKMAASLQLPKNLEINLVIALGKPKEEIALETVGADGDIKYWRDERKVHHVPKRELDEICVNC